MQVTSEACPKQQPSLLHIEKWWDVQIRAKDCDVPSSFIPTIYQYHANWAVCGGIRYIDD